MLKKRVGHSLTVMFTQPPVFKEKWVKKTSIILCVFSDNTLRKTEIDVHKELTGELIEPALDAIEGRPTTNVVNDKRTDSAAIVSGSDGPEALLAGGVPDLGLDLLAVDINDLGLELHSNGGLGVLVELVASEPPEQVRLPHRRVPNQHYFEQVLLSFLPTRHLLSFFVFFCFSLPSCVRPWDCYYCPLCVCEIA